MSIDKHFTWCKRGALSPGNKITVAIIGIWDIVPHLKGKQSHYYHEYNNFKQYLLKTCITQTITIVCDIHA